MLNLEQEEIPGAGEVGICWGSYESEGSAASEEIRPDLNRKLFLWSGDLRRIRCDAVVISRSHKGGLQTAEYDELMEAAGAQLVDEELQTMGLPRSGEARITHGYHLPSRHIVHLLRPRFPRRYEHAAKISLQRSVLTALEAAVDVGARNVIFTQFWRPRNDESHPFPNQLGAILFFKAVRRFLEQHSRLVDRIMVLVNDDENEDLRVALASHFPRDRTEVALSQSASQESDNEYEQKQFESGDSYGVPDYINDDGTVKKKSSSHLTKEDKLLRQFANDNFAELEALHAVFIGGEDSSGRPIVLWLQRKVNVRQINLDRLLVFLLRMGDEAARSSNCGDEFFFAYVHEGCGLHNVLPLPWLWEAIHSLASRFGARAKRIFIIGDMLVRLVSFGLTLELDVRRKLQFLNSTRDLLIQFPGGRLRRNFADPDEPSPQISA
mmetsp:Transcript_9351/g.28172  ORF Transcript_9351/g.28172 Transcript_9351/m.28172 type:complete len:438 (-) Transcript_9351:767-2080(-)